MRITVTWYYPAQTPRCEESIAATAVSVMISRIPAGFSRPWRTRLGDHGGRRPKTLPSSGNSPWQAAEVTLQRDLIWFSSTWGSGVILFSITLALLWDSAGKHSTLGLEAAESSTAVVFQGIPQQGNHSTHRAQGGESSPQRHHSGTEQERSPQPILPSAVRRWLWRQEHWAACSRWNSAWLIQHPRKTRGWMWRWLSSEEQGAQLKLKSYWAWSTLIMAFKGPFPLCENTA